jgi:ZIP family zinc transporter
MKKTFKFLGALVMGAVVAFGTVSCGEKKAEDSVAPQADSTVCTAAQGAIVYVDLDEILARYDMANELSSVVETKVNNIQAAPDERIHRILMLILSITLHNIPEGLAVGVAFGALQNGNCTTENLLGAISVAIGIGLQNFPEGAAVSFPLRREGFSRKRCFLLGQASAMVEPVAGVLGALLVVYAEAILPYALSFAAGSMILVAVHELIPECQKNQQAQPYLATMGIVLGFASMMLLDVMLG